MSRSERNMSARSTPPAVHNVLRVALLAACMNAGTHAQAPSPDEVLRQLVQSADDSCQYARDGACDEPDLCTPGTDVTDCRTSPSGFPDDFGEEEPSSFAASVVSASVTLLFGALMLVWMRHQFVVGNASRLVPSVTMVPRSGDTSVGRAQAVRDTVHDAFANVCKAEGIRAELFKSPPLESDIWTRVEIDQPTPGRPGYSSRAAAVITIVPREFHRFDPEMILTFATNEGREKKYDRIIELGPEAIRSACVYLAGQTTRLWVKPQRARKWPLQLWRPRNKLTGVKELRWLTGIATALRGFWWWITRDERGRMLSVSTGKPRDEPRRLIRLDSWQAVIRDIAGKTPEIRQEILQSLKGEAERGGRASPGIAMGQRARIGDEDISYHGIDGRVERRQIVAQLGRAIVFVHVYSYGNDLYVGWDAHVNAGMWAQKSVGIGVDPESGRLTRALAVSSSWQSPNEYDVTDANFLLEWVHVVLMRIIKDVMRVHEIDQEIDFEIVRESRQSALDRKEPTAARGKGKGLLNRLRRTS